MNLSPRIVFGWLVGLSVVAAASIGLNLWLITQAQDAATADHAHAEIEELGGRIDQVALGASLIAEQAQALQGQVEELLPLVDDGLEAAVTELESFESATLTFAVAVDEEVPIRAAVPFRRTIEVPVQTVIPINETIETTIEIQGPFDVDIPIDVEVPIDLAVPVDLSFPVTIDETIDVDTSVRIALDVPVEVAIAETALADLVAQLRAGLTTVRDVIAGLG